MTPNPTSDNGPLLNPVGGPDEPDPDLDEPNHDWENLQAELKKAQRRAKRSRRKGEPPADPT